MSQSSELISLSTEGESKTGVFIFGGFALAIGRVPPFEFLKTMSTNFADLDAHIYIDPSRSWYSEGFQGITSNTDETVEYLKEKIKDYERVVFMGVSSGGYAAMLFGSLLEADRVVAFVPQTDLRYGNIGQTKGRIKNEYRDILPYVNDTTEYHLYVNEEDTSAMHHPYHIDRVVELGKDNVHRKTIIKDLKHMRDNGMLVDLLRDVFYN